MTKYQKTFDLPVSYDRLWVYCCETAENIGWKVEKKADGDIVLKSGETFQTKAQILVVSISLEVTLLTIIVSTPDAELNTIDVNKIGENIHEIIIEKWVGEDVENIKIQVGINQGLVCPTCHADIMPGIRFCPNDGTPISKGCENCNATNMPSSQFCYKCGKPLELGFQNKVENPNTFDAKTANLPVYKGSGSNKNSIVPIARILVLIEIVVLGCCLFLGLLGLWYSFLQ